MLGRVRKMQGAKIAGEENTVGTLHDVYFDDQDWTVRYLVVDTGPWLFGRKVLISPEAIVGLDWSENRITTDLTQRQVEQSPDIDLARPVSRQQQVSLHDYYSWSYYWSATPMSGSMSAAGPVAVGPIAPIPSTQGPSTGADAAVSAEMREAMGQATDTESNLRSLREVTGYAVHATDGDIGSLVDFFADDGDWRMRYLLVDTTKWLPGKRVLVSPDWILRVSWSERAVYVNIPRNKVENCPEYDPKKAIDREQERRLYSHFGFPGYWV